MFGGRSHPALTSAICAQLGLPVGRSSTLRFSNDNLFVQIEESVRGKDVFVVQTCVEPVHDNLFELFMFLDAARSASARRITAVLPYYSYARSDKKDQPRISIAGRLLADLVETAGAQRFLTMTLHSPQVHGFFGIPGDHLSGLPVIEQALRERSLDGAVVVAPDIGSAKAASHLARRLGMPVAAGNKRRIDDARVEMNGIVGEITSENAIILDDEIARGTSVLELIALLRVAGVRRVWVACTHGVFTDQALARISAVPEVQEIIATDTVPIRAGQSIEKLRIASVAPLFAEAIRRIHAEESVSSLFDGH